jgi:integrase
MVGTKRGVSETICRYSPRSFSPEVAAFARAVVSAVEPPRPERAKALLFAAAKLATYGSSIGLELDEKLLFSESVIERFICSPHSGSAPTRRTLRTNLRFLARESPEHVPPQPRRLAREKAKAPYSPAEIASYLALSDAQPTKLRRARASALVCLGAGAGLVGGELRLVAGNDVVCRSGGVLVLVAGRRPRVVPVLPGFHDRLVETAAFFGPRYLVSGVNPDSHNVTNPLLRALSGGEDLPRLDTGRLRSTYLAVMAETIGLRAFMDAAGITCSQRLGDLAAGLLPRSEEEAVALLVGRR